MTDAASPLSNKERMAIDRVSMPEQAGAVRAHNFGEVNLGLTYQLAGSLGPPVWPYRRCRSGLAGSPR